MKKKLNVKKKCVLSEQKGSFTVELALLMPLLIGVFLFIFFLAYYMHDRCIIEKACYAAALRGSQQSEPDHMKVVAQETLDEVIPDRLLGRWELKHQIDVTRQEVCVSESGNMKIREGLLVLLMGKQSFTFSAKCSAKQINEPVFIRSQRKQGRGYCSEQLMNEN